MCNARNHSPGCTCGFGGQASVGCVRYVFLCRNTPFSAFSLTQGVTSAVGDAISALIALGYKSQKASRWVRAVEETGLSSETLIRRALQVAV